MVTFVAHQLKPDYVPTEGLVGWYPLDGKPLSLAPYPMMALFTIKLKVPIKIRFSDRYGPMKTELLILMLMIGAGEWWKNESTTCEAFHEEFNTPEKTVSTWAFLTKVSGDGGSKPWSPKRVAMLAITNMDILMARSLGYYYPTC